jgi:hypothetical protein
LARGSGGDVDYHRLNGLNGLYLCDTLADLLLDDSDPLYDLCIAHRERQDDDQERIEKDEQEHESPLAIQAQFLPQVW